MRPASPSREKCRCGVQRSFQTSPRAFESVQIFFSIWSIRGMIHRSEAGRQAGFGACNIGRIHQYVSVDGATFRLKEGRYMPHICVVGFEEQHRFGNRICQDTHPFAILVALAIQSNMCFVRRPMCLGDLCLVFVKMAMSKAQYLIHR